jgi:cytoskeleton protein RodZ
MDSEQDKPTSQQHASTPGAALAAAREAMGLTVEQVADQLKLAPRQVVAIEQGDYDALPNRAVTRGFIRAYAKAMRLDPVPLVAMVEVEGAAGHADATVRPTMVKASFQESRFPSLNERNNGKPMGAIVAGVAVVALVGVAVAWQTGLLAPLTLATRGDVAAPAAAPEPAAPAVVTQPGTQGSETPLQSTNVPLISVPPQTGGGNAPATVAGAGVPGTAGGVAPAAVPGTNPPPAAVSGTVAGPVPGNAPATVVAPANRAAPTVGGTQPTAPAPAAVPAAAPAPVAGQAPAVGAAGGKLVLTVKEDSWIEIRRPGQSALVARLVRAGSTETFNVREKDLLIVGKPSGVSANLAGGQLELPPVPGGTISRVPIK